MTPIDPTHPLFAQLRTYARAWSRAEGRRGEDAAAPEDAARSSADAPRSLLAQAARSVSAIAHDDPGARRKAFRLYLQVLLAKECSVGRVEDAGFQDLVDRVLDAMESDPRLKVAVDNAGGLLLDGVRKSR